MSIHRLWAILRKEFRHIQRDKRTLFLVTLSPSIMLLTFAYLFAFEVQKVRLGVWDLDQSALSRRFVASLTSDGKFEVRTTAYSYEELRESMMRSEIHIGLVIPPGFEARRMSGESSPVQAITDGSDAITVGQSLGRLRQRTLEFDRQITAPGSNFDGMISVESQAWYNRELNSKFSMVPALIPIVMILPTLALALAITREKELGSFETLITTPIQPLEYLLGKLIPYVTYGLISAIGAFLLAILWFKVPLRGSVPDLISLTVVFLFAMLGETMLIVSFLTSQGTAMQVILLLFFVPSFFLSGATIPVDTGAGAGRIISTLLPTSYFVTITRAVFLKALDVRELWTPALSLLALGFMPFVLSLVLFRKRVD